MEYSSRVVASLKFSTLKMNALNKYSRVMNFVENDISLVLIAFVVIEKDFSFYLCLFLGEIGEESGGINWDYRFF